MLKPPNTFGCFTRAVTLHSCCPLQTFQLPSLINISSLFTSAISYQAVQEGWDYQWGNSLKVWVWPWSNSRAKVLKSCFHLWFLNVCSPKPADSRTVINGFRDKLDLPWPIVYHHLFPSPLCQLWQGGCTILKHEICLLAGFLPFYYETVIV